MLITLEETKPQILLWTVPECPNRVTIPAPALNEIRILAVEAFYSVPRGGVEVGGVFFGVREPDAVHIRAFRPIRCEYSTGPSFNLSIKDQLGLAGLLDLVHSDSDLAGLTPVGWYHSHTRSEICLTPNDLQLYSEFFPERWQIALVLRPANVQPTRAGFFFRDRTGMIKYDSPAQELTIDPPGYGLPELDAEAQAAIPDKTMEAAQAPPPTRFFEPSTLIETAASSSAGSPPAIPLVPDVVAARGGNGSAATAAEFSLNHPPAPSILPAVEAGNEFGLRTFSIAESKPQSKRSLRWLWVLVVIILLASVAAATLAWTKMDKAADLGLETYDVNGAFLIRWDRESSAVRGATRVTLEIQDGADKTSIDLSRGALAAGGYGYMRRTSQISVHMTVQGAVPAEEYSNFNGTQGLGAQTSGDASGDKEQLKTEFLNENMQAAGLRRQIASLQQQLAQQRAKKK